MNMSIVRPSLRDTWGLVLQYTLSQDKLVVSVKEVMADSPASMFLQPGDLIMTINDWDIAKIHHPEVAANLFRAAGNFVTLEIHR
jgi:C-terminal processing protease CtpA/Prc